MFSNYFLLFIKRLHPCSQPQQASTLPGTNQRRVFEEHISMHGKNPSVWANAGHGAKQMIGGCLKEQRWGAGGCDEIDNLLSTFTWLINLWQRLSKGQGYGVGSGWKQPPGKGGEKACKESVNWKGTTLHWNSIIGVFSISNAHIYLFFYHHSSVLWTLPLKTIQTSNQFSTRYFWFYHLHVNWNFVSVGNTFSTVNLFWSL